MPDMGDLQFQAAMPMGHKEKIPMVKHPTQGGSTGSSKVSHQSPNVPAPTKSNAKAMPAPKGFTNATHNAHANMPKHMKGAC